MTLSDLCLLGIVVVLFALAALIFTHNGTIGDEDEGL